MRTATTLVLVTAGALASAPLTPAPLGAQGGPARTHLVIVTGLGGGAEYADTFHEWSTALRDGALESGVPEERIIWLSDEPERAPGAIRERATLEAVGEALTEVGRSAGADDRILIVLIGHGSARNGVASFNISGPDITPGELDDMLVPFQTQTVAVVNTSPSSGPFVQAVAGPNRIVITATKTERQANETQFGAHFTRAFTGGEADLDKDDRVSLLEAFRFATAGTTRYYRERDLLPTESPVLEDDGDGVGSEDPTADGLLDPQPVDETLFSLRGGEPETQADGLLAMSFWMGARAVAADAEGEGVVPDSITDPELRALYEQRLALEDSVAALRTRRNQMEQTAYEDELERLLLELALKNREIRAKGGGS